MSTRIRLPLQEPAAGRVAEDVDVRVLDRAQQRGRSSAARSWLNAEWTEATTMSSAARQSSARSSEPSGLMSHSMPASSRTPTPSASTRADARGVRERAALVEAVGHRQRLAVIGDGDVLQPGLARRHRHRPRCRPCRRSRWCACAGRRADRRDRSRRGSRTRGGGLDLAAHLAQLRRNPVEAERRVDVLLALAGDRGLVGDAEQPVLVQLEARGRSRGRAARCCAPSSR